MTRSSHLPNDRKQSRSWELLNEARNGDTVAMSRLMRYYQRYLFRIANREFPRTLQGRVGPSDVVQDTLLKLQLCLAKFSGRSEVQLRMWLRRILRNNMESTRRFHMSLRRDVARDRNLRHGRPLRQVPTPSRLSLQEETASVLFKLIGKLPPLQQQILYLRHAKGLTFPEIGQLLDRSDDATRMLWSRVIRDLQKQFGEILSLDIPDVARFMEKDLLRGVARNE